MKHFTRLIPAAVLGWMLIAGSCERSGVEPSGDGFDFSSGVFILCEGQFQATNASLSFYYPQPDSVSNHIFSRVNGVPLGDVANSMLLSGDEAYIVVNNSGRVYRAGRRDMVFRGKITGLNSPRYMVTGESPEGYPRAWISDLYSGYVLAVDPLAGTRVDSIRIGRSGERLSSEQMILNGGELFVACWSYGRQVLVIDASSGQITDSIEVGLQPNSMAVDGEGYLWVLSDGGYFYSPIPQEYASLSRIDMESHKAETMKVWDDLSPSPSDLCIDETGEYLYFLSDGVYRVSLDMEGFSGPLIPSRDRQFYSLGVDPSDGTVYVGDAVDYQQDGWVYRYHPDGSAIDSFRVGVNPCGFYFSYPTQR
jgi:DNA-binding beta-propeller fold protein YncE